MFLRGWGGWGCCRAGGQAGRAAHVGLAEWLRGWPQVQRCHGCICRQAVGRLARGLHASHALC